MNNAKKACTTLIVIVDYHKGERVVNNVRQLLAQKNVDGMEICIIDNSCDAGNRAILSALAGQEHVHLHFSDSNIGYVRGCNEAASMFSCRYVVLTNPDISWRHDTTLSELIDLMDKHPEVAVAGPRQVNDDGTTPDTVRRFPNLPAQIARRTALRKLPFVRDLVARYEQDDFDYSKSQFVDWIQSSLVIVRGDFWNAVGGLDGRYFIFMADPEICFQAWDHGYKVLYSADSIVGADGKRCSAGGFLQLFRSKALRHHLRDALAYQLRHLLRPAPRNRD